MVAIRAMVVVALVVGPTPIAWAQTPTIQIDTAHNTPKEQSESARLHWWLVAHQPATDAAIGELIYKTMLDSEDVVGRVVTTHGLECCSSR